MWVAKEIKRGVYKKVWRLSNKAKLTLWEIGCLIVGICILAVAYIYHWN